MLLESSATVVLPRFCVMIRSLETLSTSDASSPYAFIIVDRTSSASPVSAKPALARSVAFDTKFTASPVFCPALIALYTFSAISPASTPVLSDNCLICFSRSEIGTSVVSAMVETLAIPSSKSQAIFVSAVPVAAATPETGMSFFPTPSTLPPYSSIFAPASFMAWAAAVPKSFCAFSRFSRCCLAFCSLF
jgi:hypothetical protein